MPFDSTEYHPIEVQDLPKPKTFSEVYDAAADLISDESRWCQGDIAITKAGFEVAPCSDSAYQFCMIGAVVRASGRKVSANDAYVTPEVRYAQAILNVYSLYDINDQEGHDAAVAALRKAAELARQDGR